MQILEIHQVYLLHLRHLQNRRDPLALRRLPEPVADGFEGAAGHQPVARCFEIALAGRLTHL